MDQSAFELLSSVFGKPVEQLESEYEEFDMLMDMFEEKCEMCVFCVTMSAMYGVGADTILKVMFMEGIQAYRDMMVENGVDVVAIEKRVLDEMQ